MRLITARLIDIKLKEMKPFADKLRENYAIDLDSIDSEKVLSQYKNIYWYPQVNIQLAVEYLTTHPTRVAELIA